MSGGQAHEGTEFVLVVEGTMKSGGRDVTKYGIHECTYDQDKGQHNVSKKPILTGTLAEVTAAKEEMESLL